MLRKFFVIPNHSSSRRKAPFEKKASSEGDKTLSEQDKALSGHDKTLPDFDNSLGDNDDARSCRHFTQSREQKASSNPAKEP